MSGPHSPEASPAPRADPNKTIRSLRVQFGIYLQLHDLLDEAIDDGELWNTMKPRVVSLLKRAVIAENYRSEV